MRPVKLAHVWSSDMGIHASMPHVRHFLARGWRVVCLSPDGPRLDEVRAEGVEWIPISLSRRLMDPLGDLRTVREIAAACRRERFDIVHTHNIKAGLLGRVVARLAGAPRVVHTMHGMPFERTSPLPRRLVHGSLEWVAGRFVDRVLVQSAEDEATVRSHHLVAAAKLVRIGNGVPLVRFAPERVGGARARVRAELGLGRDDVLFLSAGRLVRSKGFVELAEAAAWARAQEPRVAVAIAGPRDQEKGDALTDAELEAGKVAGVRYLGERADMPELLAAADVAVLPSWNEGMPRFLMEGAAMGLPLLATDVRGCREVVRAGGGELVPARDPAALAQAMIRWTREPARRAAAGAFNRRLALAEFDLAVVVARVEAVYEELLGSAARGGGGVAGGA